MQDLPYPGSVTLVNQSTNDPPAASPLPPLAAAKASWLWPVLASVGLAAGTGALGVSTGLIPFKAATAQPAAITSPQQTTAPVVPPPAGAAKETVTWVSDDGGKTWIEVPLNKQP
jgi:hypothetical protein